MKVGFTTSFPVEVVFASGNIPVDLNNIFILNKPYNLVQNAELMGFPRNICAWIKGMYSVINTTDIDIIVGIVQGDCSNTHSLMSILQDENKKILPFSYPYDRDIEILDKEISKLERFFNVKRQETEIMKKRLDSIRRKLVYLDELTWKENLVTSFENHFFLVSSSDFNGDYIKFENDLDNFLKIAEARLPENNKYSVRLAFVGVPPILEDIYTFLEKIGAKIVFNEVQRQFSMFYLEPDIVSQYHKFTYPYTIFDRITDIKTEIKKRNIEGIISYTQSFCHRQLDNISLKKHIDLPVIQLEADQPGTLDERTKLRIESFIEMISEL